MSARTIAGTLGVCALFCAGTWAQQATPQQSNPTSTPQQQSNPTNPPQSTLPPATGQAADKNGNTSGSRSATAGMDKETSQKIHDALSNDQTLASTAQNVRVSSKNGKVTLRGTVQTEDEKKAIEQHAREVAGAGNVTDHLAVRQAKHHQ